VQFWCNFQNTNCLYPAKQLRNEQEIFTPTSLEKFSTNSSSVSKIACGCKRVCILVLYSTYQILCIPYHYPLLLLFPPSCLICTKFLYTVLVPGEIKLCKVNVTCDILDLGATTYLYPSSHPSHHLWQHHVATTLTLKQTQDDGPPNLPLWNIYIYIFHSGLHFPLQWRPNE
jgi:hypothetical protein